MPCENNTILIIEDEPAIAELIAFTVKAAGWNPVKIYSGAVALKSLAQTIPILVLLDWMLPDFSGLEILKKIRTDKRTKHLPVLMLTAKAEENDKITGLDNGADDYITKPFSPKELTARINALLRRSTPEKSKICFKANGIELDTQQYQMTVDGRPVEISWTEFLLLKFLMANPDHVFTRNQILDSIWSDNLEIEERTVDVHILRLRKILAPHSDVIQTVRGMGYKFVTKDGD